MLQYQTSRGRSVNCRSANWNVKKWFSSCHFKIETNYAVALMQLGKMHDILWQDTSADAIRVAAAVGFDFYSTVTSIIHLSCWVWFELTLNTTSFPFCGREKQRCWWFKSWHVRQIGAKTSFKSPSLQTTIRLQKKACPSWFALCNTSKVQNCKKKYLHLSLTSLMSPCRRWWFHH